MRRLPLLAALAALQLATPLPAPIAPPLQAATQPDPVDFLFRLGMLEGHLMIGHELLAARRHGLAVPHFGHPVRELYDDLVPYLAAVRFPAFEADLIRLEAAVARSAPDVETLYAAVIATLHRARATAPESVRAAIPTMIRICADTIDAAAGEYAESLNRGRIDQLVEYHDSRGFIAYAAAELARMTPSPAEIELVNQFRVILGRAQWIVEPLMPASRPRASVSQYRAIAADAAKLTQP